MDSSENPSPEQNNEQSRPRRRRRRWVWILGGLAAGLLVLVAASVSLVLLIGLGGGGTGGGGASATTTTYEEEYVSGEGADKIAVVPVEGAITSADSSLLGPEQTATPQGVQDALRQAEEDPEVAAVVLEINSPGGGVTESEQIHGDILDFKENTDKPVVVSMDATAASGGYYVATPADEIVANSSTITGSLGVIFQLTNVGEAADRLGIEQNIVKSGEFKDIGSPFRELESQERDIFKSLVDESYDEFVEVIVEGRDLSEEQVREIADGRIYSGNQAKELGLVDELGDLETAARISRDRADLDEATVVRYVQPESFGSLLGARLAPQPSEAAQIMEATGLNLEARPYYLYKPGL